MWKKVQDYIEKNKMLESGDWVLAALSGGADSVCLLSVLYRIRAAYDLKLRAVHVHHGLRGEEADRDVQFVQELCEKWEIPLVVVYRNVAAYAGEHGISTEEAGRILRYEAFEQAAKLWRQERGEIMEAEQQGKIADKKEPRIRIAVAHHQNDNAETILHHLLRGSGLKGLSGIRPVQGSRIRPLLCVSREEILEMLRSEGICWCEDSTNQELDYTRNRIRNQLIPMMKETVNLRAVENIVHAGEIFAQADEYLRHQAELVWDVYGTVGKPCSGVIEDGEVRISLIGFLKQEPIIQTYLIRHMLDLATPRWRDITSVHFEQIAALAQKQVGSRVMLPCGLLAVREYAYLAIRSQTEETRQECAKNAPDWKILSLALPALEEAPQSTENFILQAFSAKKGLEIPKNRYTKWFDYDKIKNTLCVRTRKSGDYLTLAGGGTKTAARYMIDEKIPREDRERVLLLTEGSHILWVIGGRISEYYKVTDTTKTILQVKFDGGTDDGRKGSCIIVRGRSKQQNQ